jgi:putative transcriptional regulator
MPGDEPFGDPENEPESLAGRLLVAGTSLLDPSFARTVVYLLDHDEGGALGIVINRPSDVTVEDVLPTWADLPNLSPSVFFGGPVATDSALAVGLPREPGEPAGTREVAGGLVLIDLDQDPVVMGAELAEMRVFAGYAGWGEQQLEAELAEEAWYVFDGGPIDVFSRDAADLWRTVLRRQGGELAFVASFPLDPSLN